MLKFRIALSALFAGVLLVAMPVLDIMLGAGSPGFVHAIVGGFGVALLAISATAMRGGHHAEV